MCIRDSAKADLFISIHTNSVARSRTVRGAETYTLGLHRTEANLEVAKKENSVILIEDNYCLLYTSVVSVYRNITLLSKLNRLPLVTLPD